MQILEIKFKNFKQYYGEQSLEFCVSDNSSDKNVTVVYGENGRGKTSIYRALIFALYGDTKLEQDLDNRSSYENSDEKIYTVNTKSIEEDYKNGKNGVKAFVEVTFLHNNSEYVIKREIEGIKDENQIFEQHGDVRLKYVDESNNTVILKNKDKEKIKNIINDILDERMKNYFLFDGEKIENLTRATKEQKQEVSKGIKNLLKIDNLKSSIDSLNKLERKINKELKKISTGKYKKTLKDIEEKEKQVKVFREHIKLAQSFNLPLIVHCRMAHKEVIKILKEEKASKGVVHCFTGSLDEAEEYLKLGFYLGLNGIIFKMDFKKIINALSLENIVIETDCPFLTPPPKKGRNEPLFLRYIAEKIASTKGVFLQEVEEKTTKNAIDLFLSER